MPPSFPFELDKFVCFTAGSLRTVELPPLGKKQNWIGSSLFSIARRLESNIGIRRERRRAAVFFPLFLPFPNST